MFFMYNEIQIDPFDKHWSPAMNRYLLTKSMVILGVSLTWFPILATLVIAVIGSISEQSFRLDFMMPAELGLFSILGTGLLLWAAIRLRSMIKPIAWSLALMIILLLGSQALAVASGLASGERPPSDPMFYLVTAMLTLYSLILVIPAILGARLLPETFKTDQQGDD
jgi:undecaprenyl pyrophosphate phosphatase UppP